MNLCKHLLLGSAACLAAAASAQAADLPSRKAAPVQYVRVCDAYGVGFFYIPGTNTCLRVGGYVRAEYQYTPGQKIINVSTGKVSQVAKDQDETGMEIRGRVDLDARTQTDWGTVQTVIKLRATDSDGIRHQSSTVNFGTEYAPGGNGSTSITTEAAYIRFAGLTAGRAPENFVVGPGMYFGVPWGKFSNDIKQLSYTATFGGGFSATLAVESRGDYPFNTVSGYTPAPSLVPTAANSTYVNHFDTGYNLVGNVRLDQSWGFVQLAGALGNNSTSTAPFASNDPLLGPETYGAWAVGGTVKINLPMIAHGDHVFLIGAYAHGMDGLIMTGGTSAISSGDTQRFFGGVLRNDSNLYPTAVDANGDPLSYGTENAWQIGGLYTHQWAPQWQSNFLLGYVHFDPPTANANPTLTNIATSGPAVLVQEGLNTQLGKADIWETSGNLIWSPTKGFNIGLELSYAHISQSIQNPSEAFVSAGEPGLKENQWGTKIRLERTF